jgi:hypothetical protein
MHDMGVVVAYCQRMHDIQLMVSLVKVSGIRVFVL